MRAFHLTGGGIDGLTLRDHPDPEPGPGEVAVRVEATSLNYRDLMMARRMDNDRIPLSDGAGVVTAVGAGVTTVAVGDRVAGTFFAHWVDGRAFPAMHDGALGGSVDGMLAEIVVAPEHGVIPVPAGWSSAQAATLPCAALTAWNALVEGQPLLAGQTVLLLGTGGVSVFGLQLAKAMGARAIITSSSDAKLEVMRSMGADVTINYATTPDWDRAVLDATGGVGVDLVLEVGGAGTLPRSIACTRFDGQVALIGILTGPAGETNPFPLVTRCVSLRGVYVGSRRMFAEMNAAIEVAGIEPVIDRTFAFDQAPDAYRHLTSQQHIGKVVVDHT
ncbi:MAG: NAD(P)-dependent alcohol dehydrogenase [Acidimicrobiales bacterium]